MPRGKKSDSYTYWDPDCRADPQGLTPVLTPQVIPRTSMDVQMYLVYLTHQLCFQEFGPLGLETEFGVPFLVPNSHAHTKNDQNQDLE